MRKIKNIAVFVGMLIFSTVKAQVFDSTRIIIDFEKPITYMIASITISGNTYTPEGVILLTSGLKVGQKITIPGDDTKRRKG
jgi:hypothetical protein